jgi:hypothetical protein
MYKKRNGMYSVGGVRCLRSYAFVGANHLLKRILFHKLTVLLNFRINYDLVVLGKRERVRRDPQHPLK